MYKPSYLFDRTAEERRDPFLFWKRDDQPFFAAGACHILADMFRQLHQGEDFQVVFMKGKVAIRAPMCTFGMANGCSIIMGGRLRKR